MNEKRIGNERHADSLSLLLFLALLLWLRLRA